MLRAASHGEFAAVANAEDAHDPSPAQEQRANTAGGERKRSSNLRFERVDLGGRIARVDLEEAPLDWADWDVICDVRSPSEYDEDHVPEAISAPVLSDAERAEVGTMYKRQSPFLAKRRGAGLVAANVSKILLHQLADLPEDARVLVYCWRGGERSLSLAHTLSRVGFGEVGVLQRGYKAYRQAVCRVMLRDFERFTVHIISGYTGTAKGKLLEELERRGGQVLDLEGAAEHRGSILGDIPGRPQPSQKMFESRLFRRVAGFASERPVFVEGESALIGKLQVPEAVWKRMRLAAQTELVAPTAARVAWIRQGYRAYEGADTPLLLAKLARLRRKSGHATVDRWEEQIKGERWAEFVEDMLVNHYDAVYDRCARRDRREERVTRAHVAEISDATYGALAAQLLAAHDPAFGGVLRRD